VTPTCVSFLARGCKGQHSAASVTAPRPRAAPSIRAPVVRDLPTKSALAARVRRRRIHPAKIWRVG
jgi:hypothetical protein